MIFYNRISGSSLIEITTAVTLLSMVFTSSILIYINVSRSTNAYSKLKLASQLKYIANQAVLNRNFIDEEMVFSVYSIKKRVHYYDDNENLIHLKIEGYNKSGKMICKYNKIIYDELE